MASTKAVLLDIDGTLVDSNDAHARAWVATLAEFNRPVSVERVRELIGKGGDKLLPELTGIANDSELAANIKEQRKRYSCGNTCRSCDRLRRRESYCCACERTVYGWSWRPRQGRRRCKRS